MLNNKDKYIEEFFLSFAEKRFCHKGTKSQRKMLRIFYLVSLSVCGKQNIIAEQ